MIFLLENKSIPVDSIKKKLMHLEEHFPNDKFIANFGRYFSERLPDGMINPDQFHTHALFVLFDLHRGRSGFPSKDSTRITFSDELIDTRTGLVGHSEELYGLIHQRLPAIAKAVAPHDFAEEVRKIVESYKNK